MNGRTSEGREPSGRRVPALVAVFSLVALSACTAEGTHSPKIDLAGVSSSTALVQPGAAQAYAGESETKVEASVEALATGGGLHADPDKAVPMTAERPASASLFKTVEKSGVRAAKERREAAKAAMRARAAKRRATKPPAAPPVLASARREKLAALPGVRQQKSLFSIKPVAKKTIERAKTLSEPVRVASAAALARIGRHGLRTQHSKVSVRCLEPELVRLIKRAERHFGRHAVVTSGFRSRRHNRRVGGARNSMHTTCKAADIQIKGVTKWKLASWLRKQDGRGGVGTYCHTASVHIDIGKKRDWNWRCKRRRGKRRRA